LAIPAHTSDGILLSRSETRVTKDGGCGDDYDSDDDDDTDDDDDDDDDDGNDDEGDNDDYDNDDYDIDDDDNGDDDDDDDDEGDTDDDDDDDDYDDDGDDDDDDDDDDEDDDDDDDDDDDGHDGKSHKVTRGTVPFVTAAPPVQRSVASQACLKSFLVFQIKVFMLLCDAAHSGKQLGSSVRVWVNEQGVGRATFE
jgi:hypothetical protein